MRRGFQIAAWLLGALLLTRVGLGMWLTNLGMIGLRDVLTTAPQATSTYPHVQLSNSRLTSTVLTLRQALNIQDTPTVRWSLGRVALANGEGVLAADALNPIDDQAGQNDLRTLDTLVANGYAGNVEQVIQVADTKVLTAGTQSGLFQPVIDAVAQAYLQRNQPGDLQKAFDLRPSDLFINYQLWKDAAVAGDDKQAELHQQALINFSIRAVATQDQRVIDDAVRIIPELFSSDIWDRALTARVVVYLIWQHPGPAVEQLLLKLCQQYPGDELWAGDLGELYQREGKWQAAQAVYSAVLKTDPNNVMAVLNLGLATESAGDLEQAASLYKRYSSAAPEDLLGLWRLIDVERRLGRADSSLAMTTLKTQNMWHQTALQLGLADEQIILGPELLPQGIFREAQNEFEGWRLADYATGNDLFASQAAVVVGPDSLAVYNDGLSVRLDGMRIKSNGSHLFFGLASYDAGVGTTLVLNVEPEHQYAVFGAYRTASDIEQASVYVGNPEVPLINLDLPTTNSQWRTFVAVGCFHGFRPEKMQVLLRSSGLGRVWFGVVNIRAVDVMSSNIQCRVEVSGQP